MPTDTSLAASLPLYLRFAIKDLFPLGALSLVAGRSGVGRSTLACLLAAATEVQDATSYCPNIMLIAPFADPDFQIRPRIEQLNINPVRIRIMHRLIENRDVPPEQRPQYPSRPFTFDDLRALDQNLSADESWKFLIIDNAEAFFQLPAKPSRHKLMHQLYQLQELANTHKLAVVFLASIRHETDDPFTTTFLSCLAEASRCTYLLAHDPERDQRYLFPLKNTMNFTARTRLLPNLPPHDIPDSDTYRYVTHASYADPDIPGSGDANPHFLPPDIDTYYKPPANLVKPIGLSEEIVRVQNNAALRPVELTYRQYLERKRAPRKRGPAPEARDFACEVLRHALADGPKPIGDPHKPRKGTLMHDLKAAHLTFATALRAKRQLSIHSKKTPKAWLWSLPHPPETCAPCPDDDATPALESEILNSQIPAPSPISNFRSPIPATPTPLETCAPCPEAAATPALESEILKSPIPTTPTPPETCAPCPISAPPSARGTGAESLHAV